MTLPRERTLALLYGGELLCDLTDPQKTPDIPDEIRNRARHVLRHFPSPQTLRGMAIAETLRGMHPMLDADVTENRRDYSLWF